MTAAPRAALGRRRSHRAVARRDAVPHGPRDGHPPYAERPGESRSTATRQRNKTGVDVVHTPTPREATKG
jgi:hypothetical protein